MTHPAFLAFNGKGLWVGKFETGENNSSIVIKPDVSSWGSISIANAYKTSLNYKTTLKSHMMKNTEWGAVAYLTQSIYGRCTSSTSCTEISTNSNSSHKTGYTSYSTAYPTSKDASTTGNNTGIYDMSGGRAEYVMGVMYNSSGSPIYSSSGFTASDFPTDSKYYDKYNYQTSSTSYTNRILGDATAETKGWYSDYANFIYSTEPWFHRGSQTGSGTKTGTFSFYHNKGGSSTSHTFRVVLAV